MALAAAADAGPAGGGLVRMLAAQVEEIRADPVLRVYGAGSSA